MRKLYCLLLSLILLNAGINAQVTTNSGSGLAATYPSLAAAVTALNGATITSPVVITLSGNETAPNGTGYYITATGTASNTITIQGTGTITAGLNTPGGEMDAIFKIVGGDWITIKDFDIRENVLNVVVATGATNTMTEAGILLIHSTATNGAQNNSILFNAITLSTLYPNAVAIFSTSASSTNNASPGVNTALDATSTAGTNSGNKIYNNTIYTCAFGIMFICPPITAAVFETGNDIGGSSAATQNVLTGYGNNIASTAPWNRASPASGGIIFRNGAGNNISYNNVTSIPILTVASTGILISNGTAPSGVTYTSTIRGNLINITNTGFTAITGIDFGYGIPTGTIIGSDNSVQINQTSAGANSAAIIGIKANYPSATNTVSTNAVGIFQNTSAGLTTSSVTAITCAATATGNLINVTNNLITIKQDNSGTGFYGAGPVTYVDVTTGGLNTQIVNVTGNTFNATGSAIRSTADMIVINCNSTVGLYNIKSNTVANMNRVASIGNVFFTYQTFSPSAVADTVSDNSITIGGLITSGNVTAISQLGGLSGGGAKSICNNSITLGNFGTGSTTGIAWGYSSNAKVSGNTLSIISAGPSVTGLDGTSTGAGGGGGIALNTIFLSSNTTSPTSMTGINLGGSGPFTGVTANTFSGLNYTGIITGAPVITGIAIAAGTGNTIFGNTIKSSSAGAAGSSASPVISGVLISGGTSTSVFKNKIYGFTTNATGNGTTVNGIRISGGTTNTVYNNLIGSLTASAATNTDAIRGISITSTSANTTQNIYYNTVYLSGGGGTNFGSTGIFHTASTTATTSALNLRNNIFVNACTPNGTGQAVAFRRSSGAASTLANYASTSNNNLFYAGTPGASNLIYSDGTSTATTITAYKAGTFTAGTISPRDAASVSENPPFLSTAGASAIFLHINTTVATQAESGGSPIAGITDDFDADVRNVTTPDIGGDEFTGITLDLIGPSISYTTFGNTSCLTDRTLSPVTITDASGVNVTVGTKPRLYFKKSTEANAFAGNAAGNNGWKYVEATNAATPFTFTTNYALLNSAMVVGDIIQYFVVAADLATPTPNVSINTGTFVGATPTTVDLQGQAVTSIGGSPASYTLIAAGLSGTVTIGAGQTYTSITQAGGLFADINTRGLSGNLTVNIIDASVAETGAVALNAINYYGCAVGPYTVLIKPNTTATLTGSIGAGAIIKLNGADYVTIDGSNSGGSDRSLTIQNLTATTSGNAVIWLAAPASGNGANNNTIKNCIIEGNGPAAGFAGIHMAGSTTIATNTGGLDNNNNNLLTNNLIRKVQMGIYFFGPFQFTPETGNVVSNNLFGGVTAGEALGLEAVHTDRESGMIISGNEVQNITGSSVTDRYGFRLLDFKDGQCYNNKIHDISYTGGSTSRIFGILVLSSTYITAGTPSNALFYNNAIYNLTSNSTSATWVTSGIAAAQGYGDRFYYNSIHLTGQLANSSSGLVAAFSNGDGLNTTPGNNIDVRNNAFNVAGSSGNAGASFWAFYSTAASTAGWTLNYNDLRSAGTNVTNNFVGRINATNYATLAAWQTATGMEANSISADPLFNSNANLQPLVGSPLIAAGTPLAGITTDITGFTRSAATPTIGAYEQAADVTGPSISYTVLGNTSCLTDRTLSPVTATDVSGINITAGTRPRLYYKKSINANTYVDNTSGTNGWKYVEATGAGGSPFSFTTNYSLLFGGVPVAGDIIQYFVVAQDNLGTPNVSINSGTFAATPASVALTAAAFPLTGTINSYTQVVVGLSGTVTIGAGQTYTSITQAGGLFTDINTKGLSGNLTVNIMDASVAETGAVALNAISYNGCAVAPYNLLIKPNTTATLTGSIGAGAIIKLNGADYVTIDGSNSGGSDRSLTIQNLTATTSGNAVIWLASPASGNGAINNTIKNCIIEGNSSTTSFLGMYVGGSASISLVAAGNELNSNNTISNNLFRKTQYGLALFGYAAGVPDLNNVISNNNFGTSVAGEGFALGAINTDRQQNLIVSGNEIQNITNSSTTANVFGIRLLDFKNGLAYNNKVHDMSYTGASTAKLYGIAVTSSTYATVGNPSLGQIYNNVVYKINSSATGATWNVTGILAGQGYGDKYYFNSVSLTGQVANSSSGLVAAFANGDANLNTACINIDVRDNIFSLTGSSTTAGGNFWAYYSTATAVAGSILNYNDLYCAGTGATNNVGRFNGVNYATLPLWQAATGMEANSIAADPLFNSTTSLQPLLGSPVVAAGTPIAGITTDITGFTRNVTTPTMGAYEQAGDLVGPSISYTALGNTSCVTDRILSPVTATDASGVNITAGTRPRLYYKKASNADTYVDNTNATNGWKYVEATGAGGSPFSFTTNYSLLFGGAPVIGDIIQYFVIAQDLTGTPNIAINTGTFATTPTSVALIAANFPVTVTNSYTLTTPGLTGTVNVGAAQTFKSLTETAAATGIFANINANGLSGNTTIVLMDAGIAETGAVALNAINSSGCAAGPFTLIIKPATGVTTTLTGSVTGGLINLNGADNVTIDGSNNGTNSRDLTITNTNTGTSSAIVCLTSLGAGLGATNNTIKNINLVGTTVTATSGTLFGVYSGGSAISNTSLGIDNDNNTIQNNNITKTQYGIYSSGESAANKNTGTVVSQNVMNAVSPNNLNTGGIYVRFDDGAQVSQNDISTLRHDGTTGQTGTTFGIALGVVPSNTVTTFTGSDVTNATVTRNKINGVTQLNSTGYSAFGIVVNSVTSGTTLLANNMISGVRSASTASDFSAGIVAGGGTGSTTNIYFNSVSMTGSRNAATFPSYGLAINSGDPIVNIKNNIFHNIQSSSSSGKMYAIGTGSGTFVNMTSDYNDLYVSGTSTFIGQTGGLGTTGTDRTTLANWQTATTKDANSLNLQPNFVAATDLHLAINNCSLDDKGTPIAGITNDIDADTRSITVPDIGADEFTAYNAGVLAGVVGTAVCANKAVVNTGTTYVNAGCNLIAKVLPSGGVTAVTGTINTCVTLDATTLFFNGEPYVQRHYDIEPVTTPSTATATITLYYTDAEFINYNTNNLAWPDMPTGVLGNGDPNIANVRITQFHGTPSGGLPTTPGNYTGTRVLITPTTVTYNSGIWTVTFPVTGFSGFYAHTTLSNVPLPIIVNYLTGRRQGSNHLLNWKVTCATSPRATMTLERSADSRNFTNLYSITADAARCNQPFDYTDANPLIGMNYYRLRIVDADGKVTYSTTVALLNAVKGFDIISIAPNPVVSDNFKLNVASALAGKMEIVIFDMQGRLVNRQSISLIAGYNSLPVKVANLASGTYTIKVSMADDKSKVIRFVKQ